MVKQIYQNLRLQDVGPEFAGGLLSVFFFMYVDNIHFLATVRGVLAWPPGILKVGGHIKERRS